MTNESATGCLLGILVAAAGVGLGIVVGLALLALTGGRVLVDVVEQLLASEWGTLLLFTLVVSNLIWFLKGLEVRRVLVGNLLLILASALALHLATL